MARIFILRTNDGEEFIFADREDLDLYIDTNNIENGFTVTVTEETNNG
jgi:hypothetical protein